MAARNRTYSYRQDRNPALRGNAIRANLLIDGDAALRGGHRVRQCDCSVRRRKGVNRAARNKVFRGSAEQACVACIDSLPSCKSLIINVSRGDGSPMSFVSGCGSIEVKKAALEGLTGPRQRQIRRKAVTQSYEAKARNMAPCQSSRRTATQKRLSCSSDGWRSRLYLVSCSWRSYSPPAPRIPPIRPAFLTDRPNR